MLAGGRDGAVGRCVRMLQGRDGESETGLRILLREDAAGEQRGPRTLLSIVLCEDREQAADAAVYHAPSGSTMVVGSETELRMLAAV